MNQERLLKIVLSPHVSEKTAVGLDKRNEYVFHVASDACKTEIKDAIEFLFNTKVKTVRTLNVTSKKKMYIFHIFAENKTYVFKNHPFCSYDGSAYFFYDLF